MRVIYKDSKQTIEKDYPTDIEKAVYKLDSSIQYYYINESVIDNPNPDRYDLVIKDVLTDKIHPEYKHLKICERTWELVEKPESEIIQRLNDELGLYLDEQYPAWERDKHVRKELFSKSNHEDKAYIKALDSWMDECRALRDIKQAEYLSGYWDFDFKTWIAKPLKNK